MSWFEKLIPTKVRKDTTKKTNIPEGLWSNCGKCKSVQYRTELERNLYVCVKCGYHSRISSRLRLEIFFDEDSYVEIQNDLETRDPLKFKDSKKYKDRIISARKVTGEQDALIVMHGTVVDVPVVASAFEFKFIGGSMGASVGEMFVRGVQESIENNCAYVCFTASGGARMQEGLISLFQMVKTSAILNKLHQAKLPFISVLTDPTMGGVSASIAMLGDIIMAEPEALIGFAGPRVIEQTVRHTLPQGFQRSEFLLEKGHIDMLVDRRNMREKIASIITKLTNNK